MNENIDGFFYISILTIFCGSLGLLIRYSYKSKCSKFKCCCIEIERDIEAEKEEDLTLQCKSEEKIGS